MDRLRVDTEVLRTAGQSLHRVAHEFKHANTYADDVADAVGHPGLAGAVSSLAHSWDGHRAKMLHGIEELGDTTVGVADGFELLDAELGDRIRSVR